MGRREAWLKEGDPPSSYRYTTLLPCILTTLGAASPVQTGNFIETTFVLHPHPT